MEAADLRAETGPGRCAEPSGAPSRPRAPAQPLLTLSPGAPALPRFTETPKHPELPFSTNVAPRHGHTPSALP